MDLTRTTEGRRHSRSVVITFGDRQGVEAQVTTRLTSNGLVRSDGVVVLYPIT
jgi:hypothetical protein